eukprot:4592831-Pleurochrysis_carterae.AAC.1
MAPARLSWAGVGGLPNSAVTASMSQPGGSACALVSAVVWPRMMVGCGQSWWLYGAFLVVRRTPQHFELRSWMPKRCPIWPTSKTCFPPIMTWVSESHTASPDLFGWAAGAVGLAFDARAAGAGAGRAPRAPGWGRAGTWAAALRPGKQE